MSPASTSRRTPRSAATSSAHRTAATCCAVSSAELLHVGETLFSARPFDEVSIDDIATAAGISKNLIYHYFAGKRELFLAVIAHASERMLAATAPDLTLPAADRLRGSLEAHLD